MAAAARTITCRHCETRYRVSATLACRTMTCRRCGHPVLVLDLAKQRRRMRQRTAAARLAMAHAAPVAPRPTRLQIASGVGSLLLVVAIVALFLTA